MTDYLDAATVVLLRDGAGGQGGVGHPDMAVTAQPWPSAGGGGVGLECLMVHKNRGQSFGGAWVFPGGRLEEVDGTGEAGARRAAVREAAEETGLLLDPDQLVPFAHWSPPPTAPKRFATWFFVAALPAGAADVVVDGGEIGDHVWTTPAAALARHDRDEIELMPPTWRTLHWLRDKPDVAAALADAAARPVERYSTRIVIEGDGDGGRHLVALWEPDVAYPASDDEPPGPLDAPGRRHRLYMTPGGWRLEDSTAGAGR